MAACTAGRAPDRRTESRPSWKHVADNGSGFNPSLQQSKGLGLRIMHYRAQMMAGSLRVESARARGTIVSCWFPRGGFHGLADGS